MDSIQLFPTIAARVTPAYTSVLVWVCTVVSYSCATFCASAIALAASLSSAAASGSETFHFVHNALFVVTMSGRHKAQRVKKYEKKICFSISSPDKSKSPEKYIRLVSRHGAKLNSFSPWLFGYDQTVHVQDRAGQDFRTRNATHAPFARLSSSAAATARNRWARRSSVSASLIR